MKCGRLDGLVCTWHHWQMSIACFAGSRSFTPSFSSSSIQLGTCCLAVEDFRVLRTSKLLLEDKESSADQGVLSELPNFVFTLEAIQTVLRICNCHRSPLERELQPVQATKFSMQRRDVVHDLGSYPQVLYGAVAGSEQASEASVGKYVVIGLATSRQWVEVTFGWSWWKEKT